jgi:streptogramin lyase
MTTPIPPQPGPLCATYAPLLPLISSGALEEDEATPTRTHAAGCAWCRQELALYVAMDEALRRQFGAPSETFLPFTFDLDGGDNYAFVLEDTLEDSVTGDEHNRPTTIARSMRLDTSRRGPRPRATAIAAIAAALILVIIAATIFTQIAIRRTPHPAATPTPSAMYKIALPNASARQIAQMTTAPDGSLWFTGFGSQTSKISHVASDGTLTEFPIPTNDKVKTVYTFSIAIGPDGAIWVNEADFDGMDYSRFIRRMTPDGVFTTIPVPTGLLLGLFFTGPDGGLWFSGERELNTNASPTSTYEGVTGEITTDGHFTEHLYRASPGARESLCVGPDKAIWYAVLDPVGADYTHLTGRIVRESPSGQVQEFAVPHGPNSVATGSDGALWFSEYSEFVSGGDGSVMPVARKGVIGRITTAGVASEIPIDSSLGVDQLAAGSDGAIWFTVGQDETGKFGRITPSGVLQTFTTGGNSAIVKIVAAPGAFWLLDAQNVLWHYRLPI